jgi:hypothetical protein
LIAPPLLGPIMNFDKIPPFIKEIIVLNVSIIIMNRKGNNGFACLKLLELLKKTVGVSFTNTKKRTEEVQYAIHLHHLFPKPYIFYIYKRRS